jgi:3-dehydroquinate synthase
VYNSLSIQSHKGIYTAHFTAEAFEGISDYERPIHYVVDATVARIYATQLKKVLASHSVLLIEACEANKSLDKFQGYVEHLVKHNVRRGHLLVAVGGGIIQDITCFLAATLLRGVDWHFYPTTLLAQTDSCIGSKSSINVGEAKNILGTFTPPQKVTLSSEVLQSLSAQEIHSGIGEMLKVHRIDGDNSIAEIIQAYDSMVKDPAVLQQFIFRSLKIKKKFIEEDEFDQGIRNLLNYGHSFGHAIESATHYEVPHGIAVTFGMDLANFVSAELGLASMDSFRAMHSVLMKNGKGFEKTTIPLDAFFAALQKDKKNLDLQLVLIMPNQNGEISKHAVKNDEKFKAACQKYFDTIRTMPLAD